MCCLILLISFLIFLWCSSSLCVCIGLGLMCVEVLGSGLIWVLIRKILVFFIMM